MTDWPGWLTTLLGSGIGGAFVWGIVEVVKTIANRPLRDAQAADQLSDSALEHVREARDEARQARQEANEARREASEARREAVEARREAMTAVARMRQLVTAIQSPYATIEQLRAMVADPPSSNGSALVNR
jgi:uncharacterized membrane protein